MNKLDTKTTPTAQELEDMYNRPAAEQSGSDIAARRQALREAEAAGQAAPPAENGGKAVNPALQGGTLAGRAAANNQETAPSDPESGFYSGSGKGKKGTNKSRGFWNRRRAAIAGGMLGLGLGGGSFFFLSTLPLKVLHISTNIQDTFYASFNDASDRMTHNLMRHYIVRKVVPGMVKGKCATTKVNKSCAAVSGSGNPVAALYTTWRDANLEGKFANDHGWEIKREGNKFFLRMNGQGLNETLDLGTYDGNIKRFEGRAFAQLDRSEVRRYTKTAFRDATLSKQIRYRYSALRLLERKYGVRACVMACKLVDAVNASVDAKKTAGKSYLAERVVAPYSESLSLGLQCLLDAAPCSDLNPSNEKGERLSNYQRDIIARFADYRTKHGDLALDELKKEADNIREKGLFIHLIEKMVGKTAGAVISKLSNVVGWVDLMATIINSAKTIGPTLKHINYAMNSAAMVQMFQMFRTHGDEIKQGNGIDLEAAGSVASLFDADPAKDQGGAGMESSPAWNAYFGDGTTSTTASLIPGMGTAFAQETNTRALCDDGNGYPVGALICPEVGFGVYSMLMKITSTISEVANNPVLAFPGFVAGLWQKTGGAFLNWISEQLTGALDSLTGGALTAATKQVLDWLTNTVFKRFLIVPLSANPSGARMIEMTMGGGNVAGNEAAHFAQGGRVISTTQANAMRAEQKAEKQAEFRARPLYARLLDKDDAQSLVSRIAVAMPSSRSGLLSGLLSSTGKLQLPNFFAQRTQAAIPAVDPWGITQYGYPANDPVFSQDPELYWKERDCSNPDNVRQWGDKAVDINPNTGEPEHKETNGCILIKAEVQANGGRFNPDLIEQDTNSSNSSDGTVGSLTSGSAKDLAKQIINSPNITFQTAQGKSDFQLIVENGKQTACGGRPIDPRLLSTVLALSQKYKLVLGVVENGHRCNNGYHPQGKAIDINGVNPLNGGNGGTGNSIEWSSAEQPILKSFYADAFQTLSAGGGGGMGQSNCFQGSAPAHPSNVAFFNDGCNHVHMDVGVR